MPPYRNIRKRTGFYIVFVMLTIVHFLATFVVVLFVLSTINILNESLLRINRIDYLEVVITALIVMISLFVYLSSLKRISQFINQAIFRDRL